MCSFVMLRPFRKSEPGRRMKPIDTLPVRDLIKFLMHLCQVARALHLNEGWTARGEDTSVLQ